MVAPLRKALFLNFLFCLFCFIGKAEEAPSSHSLSAQIDIRSGEKKNLSDAFDIRNGLQTVPASAYLSIPRSIVQFEAIDDRQVKVTLAKPYHFRTLKDGKIERHEISNFILEGNKSLMSQLMMLQAGRLVTHVESNLEEAQRFVDVMKSPGFTNEMLGFVEGRYGPLAVYRVLGISFNVSASQLIAGKPIPFQNASYSVETIVPHVLGSQPRDRFTIISMERSGVVVDPTDPLLEDYRQARNTLVDRVLSLKARGWWPQRDASGELRRQLTTLEEIDFLGTEKLQPLRVLCANVFMN